MTYLSEYKRVPQEMIPAASLAQQFYLRINRLLEECALQPTVKQRRGCRRVYAVQDARHRWEEHRLQNLRIFEQPQVVTGKETNRVSLNESHKLTKALLTNDIGLQETGNRVLEQRETYSVDMSKRKVTHECAARGVV